ncbi:DUF6457 domain-containing protein [Paractinoplanes atraurantiacus]|uniref:DUF6457 domain-containing protein n=1 Tax=Paractinoplanes atraurantiacus TaxID=1036182 RepID=A0A285JF99_9ACTN|nr:DUF6457 domain-containing protein [Actinoplanes atraurantiacus]SNY58497.1 hypothetical protein SAMN05421748_119119 [Actinoplanes atraurantiacus]
MSDLDAWIKVVGAELGIDPAEVPTGAVLGLAKDVAHNVVRPGAPVSAYLIGLAVGRGADPAEAVEKVRALALGWSGEQVETA